MRLVELHRGHADIHHHAIDPRKANRRHDVKHLGKAMRVEDEARRAFLGFRPALPCGDGVGIAVERMHRGAAIEQSARISARAEGRIDDDIARLRVKRSDDLFEEDGNMRSGAHLPLAFASARKLSQAAFAPAQSSPICASSAGFHSVKKRPPPWKYRPSSILPSKRK